MSKNHFLPFQINTIIFIFVWFLFTKWLPAAILKSKTNFRWHFWLFHINTKLIFQKKLHNGHRRQFWMFELHFGTHYRPFQMDMQLFFLIFDKMTAVDHISGHFRSIRNLFIFIFLIAFMAISDRYGIYIFWKCLTKWLPSAIFDVRNSLLIEFLAILDECATYIFWKFWQNGCRRPFWMSEIHFRSHFWPF